MDGATPVAIRLRRSIPEHDAYTVRLADHHFAVLATARPSNARRWVATTHWLHAHRLYRGRLVVGLGVQWTPPFRRLYGASPRPDTLQLCVGHRCLVFHLAQAEAIPKALRRFLADDRVTFVGSGSAYDRRMLRAHFDLRVARGRELRAMAGMGKVSMEEMADRFVGYPGVRKSREVAMSAWNGNRLSMDQVEYAAVDAFLAFCLGVHFFLDHIGPEEFTRDGMVSANIDEEDGSEYAFQYLGHSRAVFDDGEEVLGEDDWYEHEYYGYGCDMDDDREEVLGEDDCYEQDYGYGCDMDVDREEVLGQDDWYEQGIGVSPGSGW